MDDGARVRRASGNACSRSLPRGDCREPSEQDRPVAEGADLRADAMLKRVTVVDRARRHEPRKSILEWLLQRHRLAVRASYEYRRVPSDLWRRLSERSVYGGMHALTRRAVEDVPYDAHDSDIRVVGAASKAQLTTQDIARRRVLSSECLVNDGDLARRGRIRTFEITSDVNGRANRPKVIRRHDIDGCRWFVGPRCRHPFEGDHE